MVTYMYPTPDPFKGHIAAFGLNLLGTWVEERGRFTFDGLASDWVPEAVVGKDGWLGAEVTCLQDGGME